MKQPRVLEIVWQSLMLVLLSLALNGCSKGTSPAAGSGEYETLELRYEGVMGAVTSAELAEDLGFLAPIIYSQYNFQITSMYAGILTITVLGMTFNHVLLRVERWLTPWSAAPRE